MIKKILAIVTTPVGFLLYVAFTICTVLRAMYGASVSMAKSLKVNDVLYRHEAHDAIVREQFGELLHSCVPLVALVIWTALGFMALQVYYNVPAKYDGDSKEWKLGTYCLATVYGIVFALFLVSPDIALIASKALS